MSGNPFWDAWYFHLPNFVLAALMYSLIGRLLLQMIVPDDWDNYILKAFRRLTDPVLAAVSYVTPEVVPGAIVLLLAVFWVLLLRILLFLLFTLSGLQPATGLG
ncbi:MAG: YggT family protein [Tistlia sp.]|uniref:YggT family protein n=1 Tax=Tistlia sp. TaxID=3057121 RepID=UPI0034A5833F